MVCPVCVQLTQFISFFFIFFNVYVCMYVDKKVNMMLQGNITDYSLNYCILSFSKNVTSCYDQNRILV